MSLDTKEYASQYFHPGEALLYDFLLTHGISQNQLSKATGISPPRISMIISGRTRISTATGLRLSRFFGQDDDFWLSLQRNHDIYLYKARHGHELSVITPYTPDQPTLVSHGQPLEHLR